VVKKLEQDTVYLVDGSSYIYRAYHAIRHLSNSKGFPTNAIFGFCNMILKLMEEKSPHYIAIAFDPKGPTFRHELYRDYKANRPPMPEDLASQIPLIKSIVEGLNVLMIEISGYEADDVLGSLAKRVEAGGLKTVIVTGDKDFRQLVSPQISLWDTMRDKLTEYRQFVEDYGLEPPRIIDVMGLSGDSSDNIPGVPGVGEKTALKLVKQFGSLEKVFEHLDEIKGKKLKENLSKFHDDALLSKRLVAIDCHVPMDVAVEDLKIGRPDKDTLAEIFRELEFRGLWEKYSPEKEALGKDYQLIFSEESLLLLKKAIQEKRRLSIHTETTGSEPMRAGLVGLSFSVENNCAYYLPLDHRYLGVPDQLPMKRALDILKDVLEDSAVTKIGHDIKHDALVLKTHDIELNGIHFDTMIASYVINPGLRQHHLNALSHHYLKHKMISYLDVVGKGKNQCNFSQIAVEKAMEYACENADVTLQLGDVLRDKLQADNNEELFFHLEMRLLPVLSLMEWHGIKVDTSFLKEMSRRCAVQLKNIEQEIYREAGMEFNINSPQQLGFVLFEKLGLPAQKKTSKTKSYSTDVNVLKKLTALPYDIPKLLLRYRTLTKLKNTYLDALVNMVHPSTGRIHTSFNQTIAATGRLSSSNPNLQNIPIRGEEGREIRKGFVSEDGYYLLSADYSQIELRVFAHYSGDTAFLDAFNRGEDIHSRTASELLNVPNDDVTPDMRRIAKAINFGIIYGMGPQKLSEELGIDIRTAKEYISAYYEKYQGVSQFKESTIASLRPSA